MTDKFTIEQLEAAWERINHQDEIGFDEFLTELTRPQWKRDKEALEVAIESLESFAGSPTSTTSIALAKIKELRDEC